MITELDKKAIRMLVLNRIGKPDGFGAIRVNGGREMTYRRPWNGHSTLRIRFSGKCLSLPDFIPYASRNACCNGKGYIIRVDGAKRRSEPCLCALKGAAKAGLSLIEAPDGIFVELSAFRVDVYPMNPFKRAFCWMKISITAAWSRLKRRNIRKKFQKNSKA